MSKKFSLLAVGITIFSGIVSSCSKSNDASPSAGALIINIDDNLLDNSNRLWFSVSDLKGNILDFKEASNGHKISLTYASSFGDDNVYLTQFYAAGTGSQQTCYAASYLVPRISEFTFVAPAQPGNILGNSTIKITGVDNQNIIYSYSLDHPGQSSDNSDIAGELTIQPQHFTSPDNFFISVLQQNDSVASYKIIKDVEINKEYDVDFSSFIRMSHATVTVPSNDLVYYNFSGYNNDDPGIAHYVSGGSFNDKRTNVKVYFPGTGFSGFRSLIHFNQGNDRYEIYQFGNIPTTVSKPSFGISLDKIGIDDFLINTSGNYDLVYTSFSNQDNTFVWSVFNPENSTFAGKLPEIPTEISNAFSIAKRGNLTFTQAVVLQFDEISDYNDYIKKAVGQHFSAVKNYAGLYKTGI